MNEEKLKAALKDQGVERYFDVARAASRNAIRMGFKPTTKSKLGSSRLGGLPDLPAGVDWPTYKDGRPLDFIAQIRLEDAAPCDVDGLLPKKGWLWFFVLGNWDGTRKNEPDYLSVSRVLFYSGKKLARAQLPDDYVRWFRGAKIKRPFKACEIAFTRMLTIADVKVPEKDHAAVNTALHEYCSPSDGYKPNVICPAAEHHLLGVTGDYSSLSKSHELLYHCNGHKPAQMSWGDAGLIYFWIPKESLKARDFDKVRSDYIG